MNIFSPLLHIPWTLNIWSWHLWGGEADNDLVLIARWSLWVSKSRHAKNFQYLWPLTPDIVYLLWGCVALGSGDAEVSPTLEVERAWWSDSGPQGRLGDPKTSLRCVITSPTSPAKPALWCPDISSPFSSCQKDKLPTPNSEVENPLLDPSRKN